MRTYEPNGSNEHDELCRCPGCSGDLSPEEQREEMQRVAKESELLPVGTRVLATDPECGLDQEPAVIFDVDPEDTRLPYCVLLDKPVTFADGETRPLYFWLESKQVVHATK